MKFRRSPSSFSFAISLVIVWALAAGMTSGKSDTSGVVPVTLNDITEQKHNGYIDSHAEFNSARVHSRNLVDNQPTVTSSVCYLDQAVTATVPVPDGAIVINDQSGTAVDFTITNIWLAGTLAVKYEIDNLTSQCTIKESFLPLGSEDFEAQCVGEVTSVGIIVYFDNEFSADECDACNVDEASLMDYLVCAYSIEIPCGSLPSQSPSVSPSDSPSDAPTDSPSETPTDSPSDAPSVSQTDSPSDAPTDSPSEAPTDLPSDTPSVSPNDSPNDAPTVSPSDAPSECADVRGEVTLEFDNQIKTSKCKRLRRAVQKKEISNKMAKEICESTTYNGSQPDGEVFTKCKETCGDLGLGPCA